jgi:hypothetical protein
MSSLQNSKTKYNQIELNAKQDSIKIDLSLGLLLSAALTDASAHCTWPLCISTSSIHATTSAGSKVGFRLVAHAICSGHYVLPAAAVLLIPAAAKAQRQTSCEWLVLHN